MKRSTTPPIARRGPVTRRVRGIVLVAALPTELLAVAQVAHAL